MGTADKTILLGLDTKTAKGVIHRQYFLTRGNEIRGGFSKWTVFAAHDSKEFLKGLDATKEKLLICLYPTRTYSKGFGGGMFSDIAPEDRAVIRAAKRHFGADNVVAQKVSLKESALFEKLPGYLSDSGQIDQYKKEKGTFTFSDSVEQQAQKRSLIQFDFNYIKNMGSIFKSVMTKPNRQDMFYLVTKTFGINLIVRLSFALISVQSASGGALRMAQNWILSYLPNGNSIGTLPLYRMIASTTWYQIQDIVFTIFGQTYMKFLGRMSGMFRVYKAYIGDFLFVYIQFSCFEFLNRLVLGPLGENPLVYTPKGIALVLLNNFQGLISGGIMTPAINKMRESGLITHSTMMHLYQISSFSFYFGLFAAYGFQTIYTILTSSFLVVAWSAFILVSVFLKDGKYEHLTTNTGTLDKLAENCYAHMQKAEAKGVAV
jgi:hypothetical protein